MFDRNNRYSREEESGDLAELASVEIYARQNHDHRLSDGIRWRKEVRVERKDPKLISSVAWYLAMPFDIYSKRHELVRTAGIVPGVTIYAQAQAGIPIQSKRPIPTSSRDKPRAPGPAQQGTV